ncbi:hypothetical protein FOA52_008682 [Chlamydomonas sp. UWO 241]|nr:hypothetical protein FOA52_008682 [Chlamydomonas sp. UWO 241]
MYAIKVAPSTSTSVNLSEQQLVACAPSLPGSGGGCSGGWVDVAIDYVYAVNQTTEERYPYAQSASATTAACNAALVNSASPGEAVKLSGTTVYVTPNSKAALIAALGTAPVVAYFAELRIEGGKDDNGKGNSGNGNGNGGPNGESKGNDNKSPKGNQQPKDDEKIVKTGKSEDGGNAKSINWVTAGAVSSPKHQGDFVGGCTSGWAFAATAAVEAMYAIQVAPSTGTSVNLSEQHLVSCAPSMPDSGVGCSGGWVDVAIDYVYAVNQTTEERYPYAQSASATTAACDAALVDGASPGQAVKLSGTTVYVTPNSEAALIAALGTAPVVAYFAGTLTGPGLLCFVVVVVTAGGGGRGEHSRALRSTTRYKAYSGGVYTPDTCDPAGLNHALVIVGYTTDGSDGAYWLVKNSWGTEWGEAGYARIAMTGDGDGPCGLYAQLFQPPTGFTSAPLA